MKTPIISDLNAAKSIPLFALEFFVPENEAAMDALLLRVDRMSAFQPLFVSITGGNALEDIALFAKKMLTLQINILVQIDCSEILRPAFKSILDTLKENGIKNILIIFGNGSKVGQHGGFSNALDIMKFIKHYFRMQFCVSMKCTPEYSSSKNGKYEQVESMKALLQAGVSYFITEIIFDCQLFFDFVYLCNHYEIQCPIVPTVLPIQSYRSYQKIVSSCNIHVPSVIFNTMLDADTHADIEHTEVT